MDSYTKRPGTSGISGQLYETKIIGLILFRLLHDENVEKFLLASNMDEIGWFDDICVRIKTRNSDRSILVFIQVKHKDNEESCLKLETQDLIKLHDSMSSIRERYTTGKRQDVFFEGNFNDVDCLFIIYTNAKCNLDSDKQHDSPVASDLNKWITIGENVGTYPLYTDKQVSEVGSKILNEEIGVLATRLMKYINDKTNKSMSMLDDEYIQMYHVILAQTVFNVSEIQADEQRTDLKWRILTFRPDFFETNDSNLSLLKENLYSLALKHRAEDVRKQSDINSDELIYTFLNEASVINLSYLIETHVTYNNNQLEFITDRPVSDMKLLKQIDFQSSQIEEAKTIAAQKLLLDIELKIPISFGNIDIIISGDIEEIRKKIDILTIKIDNLCRNSNKIGDYEVVTIDKTVDEVILSSDAGLGAGVGNILIYDDDSKLLKFSDTYSIQQKNAEMLYCNLKNKISDIDKLRFEVTSRYAKLKFDCSDKAKEVLNNLLIYANQKNHFDVETVLKQEIQCRYSTEPHYFEINIDLIFLYFHNEIQKRWMSQNTGAYLSETSNICKQAIENIMLQPRMNALQNKFDVNNCKYYRYKFNEFATEFLESLETSTTNVIITDVFIFTTMKVIQYLKKDIAVIDFDSVLDLNTEDFDGLNEELNKTNKIVVLLFDNVQISRNVYTRLDKLADAVVEKKVIVITNSLLAKIIQDYFPDANILNDENQSISLLMPAIQKDFIQNTRAIFQGVEVGLESLTDGMPLDCIKGSVLTKIIQNEVLTIGDSLSSNIYEEIKHYYIERKLRRTTDTTTTTIDYSAPSKECLAFYDIDKDVVLILASAGMSEKTFLNHLTQTTKDDNVWITTKQSIYDLIEKMDWLDVLSRILGDLSQNKEMFLARLSIANEKLFAYTKGSTLAKAIHDQIQSNGEPLSSYEDKKHLYIEKGIRQILDSIILTNVHNNPFRSQYCKTFNDIDNEVVLITAPPGMGKSTLLTHLSLKTKAVDSSVWIIRMNLLDYTKEFAKWKATEKIEDLDSLRFVCQVVSKNKSLLKLKNNNEDVYLDSNTGNDWTTFIVNIFLNHYNRGKLIFIFDGVDETCPNYKDSVIDFISRLINIRRGNKIWVSSRPYSYILSDLEKVLGKAYEIDFIHAMEQIDLLNSIWYAKLKFDVLNETQIKNIFSFLDYFLPERRLSGDIKYRGAFYPFFDYVYSHFPHSEVLTSKFFYKTDRDFHYTQMPLSLYVIAHHLMSFINSTKIIDWETDKCHHRVIMFKMFAETKVKKILFEEKNKMDVYNPYIKNMYEKELHDCITLLKRIAACVLLGNFFYSDEFKVKEIKDMRPFSEEEFENILKKIRSGEEKSGLISYITEDNVPVFIHRSFTEYFTAEFVCDIYRSNSIKSDRKRLMHTAVSMSGDFFEVGVLIGENMVIDTELRNVVKELESNRPATAFVDLMDACPRETALDFAAGVGWCKEKRIRFLSSVPDDYEEDCFSIFTKEFSDTFLNLAPIEKLATLKDHWLNIVARMKPELKLYF